MASSAEERYQTGTYLTDGRRLLRVVSLVTLSKRPVKRRLVLEDCALPCDDGDHINRETLSLQQAAKLRVVLPASDKQVDAAPEQRLAGGHALRLASQHLS